MKAKANKITGANAGERRLLANAEGWIHRSFALHELKRTQGAFDQLIPVAEKFPNEWTIPYNLACYCAQLGRLSEIAEVSTRRIVWLTWGLLILTAVLAYVAHRTDTTVSRIHAITEQHEKHQQTNATAPQKP